MCVCACVYPFKGPKSNDTPIAMSIFNAQILVSEYHLPLIEPGLHGRTANPGLKQGIYNVNLEHLNVQNNKNVPKYQCEHLQRQQELACI